jgi:hypothetical protein
MVAIMVEEYLGKLGGVLRKRDDVNVPAAEATASEGSVQGHACW